MKLSKYIIPLEYLANAFELIAVIVVLIFALLFQFVLNELPCPLCLLQRIGFMSIAFGFLLNLRFGLRPSHYSIIILSALFTSFVALRQISLHVIPGTEPYGSAIFGMHLYTWSFIAAMLVVVGTTILVGVDRQYRKEIKSIKKGKFFMYAIFGVICFILMANIISVLFECGLGACPDNPVMYKVQI